jgi:periplasmic divalent cation tolerance protein
MITAPEEDAQRVASGLVDRKLAACVQVVSGAQSLFFWEGQVQQEGEALLIIKTKTELQDEITAFLKSEHPYDVPEFLLFPVEGGHPEYLSWMQESLSS